jgi:hypothetical protein
MHTDRRDAQHGDALHVVVIVDMLYTTERVGRALLPINTSALLQVFGGEKV